MLRIAAERGRRERPRLRRCRGLGQVELGRRPFDAAAETVRRLVIGRPDTCSHPEQDADGDEEAAHPPDDACGGRRPGRVTFARWRTCCWPGSASTATTS